MSADCEITVLIVEDNEITRIGLQVILSHMAGLKVIGSVTDGATAVKQALELKPTIVVMDNTLLEIGGIEATRQIKAEGAGIRVILLSSDDTDEVLFAALAAGADGYCLKELSKSQLEMAIKSVARGAAWLDPAVSGRVLGNAPAIGQESFISDLSKAIRPECPLSARELDVLRLVIEGNSNQEIGDRLRLSVETVKTHMRHILEKLAVSDRTQAAVKAMRQGLI